MVRLSVVSFDGGVSGGFWGFVWLVVWCGLFKNRCWSCFVMGWRVCVLSTVGTSILSNMEREANLPDVVRGFVEKGPSRAGVDSEVQGECERIAEAGRGDPVFEFILSRVRGEPGRFSAELNALIKFFSRYSRAIEEAEVFLLPTDTGCSMLCAEVIRRYIEDYLDELRSKSGLGQGVKLKCESPRVVRGFGVDVGWYTGQGFVNLMNELARVIRDKLGSGYKVIVNATGGFKPEAYVVGLIASLMGAHKIIYIHESFRELVELPVLPLTVRSDYVKVLGKIGEGETKEQLKREGIDVEDLEVRGLVEVGEVVKVQEWVSTVIKELRE